MTSVTLTIHVQGQRPTALIIFLIHVYLTILTGIQLSHEVYIYIYIRLISKLTGNNI